MNSSLYVSSKSDSGSTSSRKGNKIYFRELPITESSIKNKPKDYYNLLYVSFIFQGAALLMPFSTFIFLVDFYQEKFCELNILYSAMTSVILSTSLFFAVITTLIADRVSIAKRLFTGHIMFILSLGFFLVFSILITFGVFNNSPPFIGYVPLIAGFMSGVGSGIVQPSYYGLSSLLPSRYTQALVVGETVSGVIIACFRVGTRLLKPVGSCESYDTVVFVAMTVILMVASVAVLKFIFVHEYTNYWLKQVRNNFLVEYNVLEQGRVDSFEDDESVISGRTDTLISEQSSLNARSKVSSNFLVFKSIIKKKAIIFKKTWQLQITIFSAMIITLFLFPTFLTAAYACEYQLCDWGPIITLCVFTLFDFTTRWFTLIPVNYNHLAIFILSLTRILFIPIFAIFIFPISNPLVPFNIGFPLFLIVVAAFGVSNGFFASIPLILIPKKLKANEKESGGNIAIFILFIGLAVGTLSSFPFNETVLVRDGNTTSMCCVTQSANATWSILRNNTSSQLGDCTCAM